MSLLDKDNNYILSEHKLKESSIEEFISNYTRDTDFHIVEDKDIYHYTWADVEAFIDICVDFCKKYSISGIYAVPRGGLILGTLLSYKAGIPLLASPIQDCLVIDDAAVSGSALLPYYKRFYIAVMFVANKCPLTADVTYPITCEVVKFPWQK